MSRMVRKLLINSSVCGCDEEARRLKACSQISVMAYLAEPSWQVELDAREERIEVRVGDRSYGEPNSDSLGEDLMVLYFRTPSTLRDLGWALVEGGRRLDQILGARPRNAVSGEDAVSGEPRRDGGTARGARKDGPVPGGAGVSSASDGSGRRDS